MPRRDAAPHCHLYKCSLQTLPRSFTLLPADAATFACCDMMLPLDAACRQTPRHLHTLQPLRLIIFWLAPLRYSVCALI